MLKSFRDKEGDCESLMLMSESMDLPRHVSDVNISGKVGMLLLEEFATAKSAEKEYMMPSAPMEQIKLSELTWLMNPGLRPNLGESDLISQTLMIWMHNQQLWTTHPLSLWPKIHLSALPMPMSPKII
jgi:hypothetical protein